MKQYDVPFDKKLKTTMVRIKFTLKVNQITSPEAIFKDVVIKATPRYNGPKYSCGVIEK